MNVIEFMYKMQNYAMALDVFALIICANAFGSSAAFIVIGLMFIYMFILHSHTDEAGYDPIGFSMI